MAQWGGPHMDEHLPAVLMGNLGPRTGAIFHFRFSRPGRWWRATSWRGSQRSYSTSSQQQQEIRAITLHSEAINNNNNNNSTR